MVLRAEVPQCMVWVGMLTSSPSGWTCSKLASCTLLAWVCCSRQGLLGVVLTPHLGLRPGYAPAPTHGRAVEFGYLASPPQ